MSMPAIKFTFDDSPEFEGFAHGSTWNGFDNVAITVEERAKIATWMKSESHDSEAVREEIADLMAIEPIKENGLISLGWGYATQIVRPDEPLKLPQNAEAVIALRFVTILQSWLTEAEWQGMRVLNAAEKNDKICHSHDFCDANMAMCEAFESVTGRTPDVDDERISALWNEAWELAMPILGRKR